MEVILRSGQVISLSDYQKINKLDKSMLSEHFSVAEFDCEGKLKVAEPLIHFLELLRAVIKRPIIITSGFRTPGYQKRLQGSNKGAATVSPHVVGMAADIDTKSAEETHELVKTILDLASKHPYDVRVGYKQYLNMGSTFVHIDVCPLYFGEKGPYKDKEVPAVWRKKNLTW